MAESQVVDAESEDARKAVDALSKNLSELGTHMQHFSSSMRSLYVENSVSSSVQHGSEFIKLRDATRNDAIVYLKEIMPLNEDVVLKVQEFVEFYEALTFEEWKEMVDDILEEVEACKEKCFFLVKIHEGMLTVLKKRKDDAEVLCSKFNNLQKSYDEKVDQLRKSANWKASYADYLYFVPIVGVMLNSAARNALAQATAEEGQQEIIVTATNAVREVLMPALESFITGLEIIGGFFKIMENELRSFKDAAGKKKLHYLRLAKKSAEIKMGCRAFYGVLPAVRTNFQAIPTEGTDFNYVDHWLEEQKKAIEANRREEMLRLKNKFMFQIRQYFTNTDPEDD